MMRTPLIGKQHNKDIFKESKSKVEMVTSVRKKKTKHIFVCGYIMMREITRIRYDNVKIGMGVRHGKPKEAMHETLASQLGETSVQEKIVDTRDRRLWIQTKPHDTNYKTKKEVHVL